MAAVDNPKGQNSDDLSSRKYSGYLELDEHREKQSPENKTLESVSAEHQEATEKYRQSLAYRKTRDVLVNVILKQKNLKINSGMCLGLFSFTDDHPARKCRYGNKSLAQLIAFEGWIDVLRSEHQIDTVYFQEPQFNPLDKAFLESRGYTVIRSPESENLLDEHTFLYTPAETSVTLSCLSVPSPPGVWVEIDFLFHRSFEYQPREDGGDRSCLRGRSLDEPRIPKVQDPAEKQLVTAYMNTHARLKWLDNSRRYNWLYDDYIYYLPDSKDDIQEWEWEYDDDELYTDEQADAHWKAKGIDFKR